MPCANIVTLHSSLQLVRMNGHFLFRHFSRKWDLVTLRTSRKPRPLKLSTSHTSWNKSPGDTSLAEIAIDGEQMYSLISNTQLPKLTNLFLPLWAPETRHSSSSYAHLSKGHFRHQSRPSSCLSALGKRTRRVHRGIHPKIWQVLPTRSWVSEFVHHRT